MLLTVLVLAIALCFFSPRKMLGSVAAALGLGCLYLACATRALDRAHLAAARRHHHLSAARGAGAPRARGAWRASRSSRSPRRVVYAMFGHHLPGVFQARPSISPGCWSTSPSTPTRARDRAPDRDHVVVPFILLGNVLGAGGGSGSSPTSRARGWGATAAARARWRWSARACSHDLGQRGGERDRGGRDHHPAHEALGVPAQIAAADRGRGSTGPAHAAVDGAGGLLMPRCCRCPTRK